MYQRIQPRGIFLEQFVTGLSYQLLQKSNVPDTVRLPSLGKLSTSERKRHDGK